MTETSVETEVYQRWQTEAEEDLESLRVNYKAVFEALKARGVDYVNVPFSGGHDEGFTESPTFLQNIKSTADRIGTRVISLDQLEVEVPWIDTEIIESDEYSETFGLVERQVTLLKAVTDLADKGLVGFLGDAWWDGTEDTDGSIVFDIAENCLRCERAEMQRVELPSAVLKLESITDEEEEEEES